VLPLHYTPIIKAAQNSRLRLSIFKIIAEQFWISRAKGIRFLCQQPKKRPVRQLGSKEEEESKGKIRLITKKNTFLFRNTPLQTIISIIIKALEKQELRNGG
jgi:hypothetical protein